MFYLQNIIYTTQENLLRLSSWVSDCSTFSQKIKIWTKNFSFTRTYEKDFYSTIPNSNRKAQLLQVVKQPCDIRERFKDFAYICEKEDCTVQIGTVATEVYPRKKIVNKCPKEGNFIYKTQGKTRTIAILFQLVAVFVCEIKLHVVWERTTKGHSRII